MITKFFVLIFLCIATNQYTFDMNVKGNMIKYNSYTMLEVKLDI